jgi:riboflavin kinase/FMN adenylyltransferase
VTIGVYDGVHLGHRMLLAGLEAVAREGGLRSVVVTFDRHPASVVRPESAPRLLTDLPQRLELLAAAGVDEVVVIDFTPERAAQSAEDFVHEVLVGDLAAKVVLVGSDFHFGRGRGGNVELLEKIGPSAGFRARPFDLVADDRDGVVSSTRIRGLVADGDLEEAARLLGRPHEVRGIVAGGAGAHRAGGGGVSVVVAPEILLPPPGGYEVLAGVVGAGGVALDRCHVVVPPRGGDLTVLGLRPPPVPGTPLRVRFETASVH